MSYRHRQAVVGEPLTPHQQRVADGLARGLSNAEIAHELSLSIETVKSHARQVYAKLGARNRTQAALLLTAEQLGARSDH